MSLIPTPTGSRKQAAAVGMPVSVLTTALPPVRSIAVTRILVIKPKVWSAISPTQEGLHVTTAAYCEDQMSVDAISSSDDLEESMGVGGFALELDSKGSKENDLYGSPRCVPEGAGDAIAIGDLLLSAVDLICEEAG